MVNCITVANSKGGVCKSTTVSSMSAALKMKGLEVLIIDMDGQGNCSTICGAGRTKNTVYEVVMGNVPIDKAIQKTDLGDIVSYDPRMSQLDVELSGLKGKEGLLDVALSKMKSKYDIILIDTPPALGTPLANALTCSDWLLIPTTLDAFGIDGIDQLTIMVKKIQQRTNKKLKVVGILPTRVQSRLAIERIAADMLTDKAKALNTSLFETGIRNCSAIRESQLTGQSIFEYGKRSNAARDYSKATDELLDRIKKTPNRKTTKTPKD